MVDQLSERYGERFASIAAVGSYVVNGERASRDTVIAEGDEVALLPTRERRPLAVPGRSARQGVCAYWPVVRFQHVLLIVNPVARTVSKPTLAVIEKALSADFRLEVIETKERGHANEIAAQAVHEGVDLVVVFSGDGTINEVVNALAGTETALGVIPGRSHEHPGARARPADRTRSMPPAS